MSRVLAYAKNLSSGWVSFAANLAVTFFLSPFVVHSLGNTAYGVWSLLVTMTGYLGLVEIGVRVSTGRFINFHLGREEWPEMNKVLNTSLAFYSAAGLVIFGLAAIVGIKFGAIFPKMPVDIAADSVWVLLLLAGNVWMGCFSATFTQLLLARDRFDLKAVSDLSVLLFRALAIVYVLMSGGGLIALSLVSVGTGALGCVLLYAFARWKGPAFAIGWVWVSRRTLRELLGFGAWAVVGILNGRILYYAAAAVIGYYLGADDVTFFSIALMLVDYGRALVSNVAWALQPDIQKAGGRMDLAALRWLNVKVTRITMAMTVPLFVGFMVFGQEFLRLWMGKGYETSGWVLLILALPQLPAMACLGGEACLLALGNVRFLAAASGVELVVALAFSVLLVLATPWGVCGVAMGILISTAVMSGAVKPAYVCRRTGMKVSSFLAATSLRWGAGSVLLTGVCLLVRALIPASGWLLFAAKVSALIVLYLPIGSFVVLSNEEVKAMWTVLRRALGRPAATSA